MIKTDASHVYASEECPEKRSSVRTLRYEGKIPLRRIGRAVPQVKARRHPGPYLTYPAKGPKTLGPDKVSAPNKLILVKSY